MQWHTLNALLNNAALLLVLSVIYEVAGFLPRKYARLQPYFSGVLISLICTAIMLNPFILQSGIIFDTRSVLISVTALTFGFIPTALTVGVAIIVRLSIGGSGSFMGVVVILSSASIGLIWRKWVFERLKFSASLNIYIMSIIVHIVMMMCVLLLPKIVWIEVMSATAPLVMLIYPIVTVLLSLLLMRQQTLKKTQEQLKQSEEKFKLLFEKAPLGYQSLDANGCIIDVNQQWCELFGYEKEEIIGSWFGNFLSTENSEEFNDDYQKFRNKGYLHTEFEVLHKNGKTIFISFEGKVGYDQDGAFKQTHCIMKDVTAQKLAEEALIESEKKYRNIAENMSDVVWLMDLNLNTIYISPSVERLLGETPEQHLSRDISDKFPTETFELVGKLLMEEMQKEKDPTVDKNRHLTIELQHYKADKTIIWIEMSISFIKDDEGNAIGLQGASRDITLRKQVEAELKEIERRESVLLSHLPGMAYKCKYEKDATMLIVSAGCYDLTGYDPEYFVNNRNMRFSDIISPEYKEQLWLEWQSKVPYHLPYKCEYEITTATNERKWVLEIGQGVYNEFDEVESLEGIILDISDKKAVENNLRYLNEHDRLTGLYNRDYLEAVLESDLKRNDGLKRALISINLSKVQLLVSNYGFHYTQNLVKKAVTVLVECCDSNRTLFQTYENRFVFYVVDYKDKAELITYCEKIADILIELFITDRIGGGIGIIEIDQSNDQNEVDQLLRKLLIASERSISIYEKDFRACFYDEELEALVNKEFDIKEALSLIAANKKTSSKLFLQFQPIYDLKTNTISEFEALARLWIEDYGLIPPVEFIPIAEKSQLIVPIGDMVIVKAFRFLKKLAKNGHNNIDISINISAIQLFRPDFVDSMFDMINEMKVNPNNIGIEITESIFTSDYDDINMIIEKLKAKGVHIAIDDFGTGYSSLAREKELNVDCLKIDKYFIDKLTNEDLSKAIVSDVISMAHKLGHTTVAEGVEKKIQFDYLKEHNCDRIQGFFISKALDEEDALNYLKKQIFT